MKTISAYLNINNHELNQSITTKKSYRNYKYYQNYDHAAGDINRNAAISQVECQRDACEEELYRLRYGIEKLLANSQQGDFRERQQQQRFEHVQNPFRTMTNKITDFSNRKKMSWLDQCSPCCRRWRRYICDENVNTPNEYNYRPVYNDRNYDLPSRRTHNESPPQSQLHSQSFVSTSPTPSISPHYIEPNTRDPNSDLRRSIDNLMYQNMPNKTNISDMLTSKDINDPVYNSLILKILEAKALDCLCTGYSKQNTQKQISHTLDEINQRTDEHPWDSVSATSSRSLPASYEPSSSDSSILTNDESISSPSITPDVYSPSSSIIEPHSEDQTTSILESPDEMKDSLQSNEDVKSPSKKPKARNRADKRSRSNKSVKKTKPSSKHRKQSRKKHGKSKTSRKHGKSKTPRKKASKSKTSRKKSGKSKTSRKKPGKSKTSRKKSSKSKKSRKPGKSKKSRKRLSSSKSKKKKGSSKSSTRSKTSKKHKSKKKKNSKKRKKRTKPKSNNQINDYETVISPTFIYPQSYQEVYRNRQRLLST